MNAAETEWLNNKTILYKEKEDMLDQIARLNNESMNLKTELEEKLNHIKELHSTMKDYEVRLTNEKVVVVELENAKSTIAGLEKDLEVRFNVLIG